MTVEDTTSKQIAQQMGNSFEYPFTFTVLLSDPTEEDAKKLVPLNVQKLSDYINRQENPQQFMRLLLTFCKPSSKDFSYGNQKPKIRIG